MRLPQLALFYALVGAGCAAAALAARRRGGAERLLDALLVLGFWPLYGPFLLLRLGGHDEGGGLGAALRRAAATPLGALLPDPATVRALAGRLQVASGKVREIDELLRRPEFSEEETRRRVEALRARGASDMAVSTAGIRLANIRRLRALRDRFVRELDEVGELLTQLTTHVEVVRLAGQPDESTRDLVRELVARVEGLDQMLDEGDADDPGR